MTIPYSFEFDGRELLRGVLEGIEDRLERQESLMVRIVERIVDEVTERIGNSRAVDVAAMIPECIDMFNARVLERQDNPGFSRPQISDYCDPDLVNKKGHCFPAELDALYALNALTGIIEEYAEDVFKKYLKAWTEVEQCLR